MPTGFQIPGQAYDPYTGEPLNPEEQEAYARLQQRQSNGFNVPVQEYGPVGPQGPVAPPPQFSLPPGILPAGRPLSGPTVGSVINDVTDEIGTATMDALSPERYINRFGNSVSDIWNNGPGARKQTTDTTTGIGSRALDAVESVPIVGETARRAIEIAGAPGSAGLGAANLVLTAGGGIAARNLAEQAGLGETGQTIADVAGSIVAPVAGARAVRGAAKGIDDFLGEAPEGYRSPSQRGVLRSQIVPGVGPDDASLTPYESARRELIEKIAEERSIEDRVAQEISNNRTSATARYRSVFNFLRSKGVEVEEAERQARRTLSGRQRETFVGPIEITSEAKSALREKIADAGLLEYQQTRAFVAFDRLVDGLGTNKSERTLLSHVFGDDLVDNLINRTVRAKRNEINNIVEKELFTKNNLKPPRGFAPGADKNAPNFGPARHAAKTETERIKNAAMAAKAAQKEADTAAAARAQAASSRGETFRARNEASQKMEAQRILTNASARDRIAMVEAKQAVERAQQQARARADAELRRGEAFRKRNAAANPSPRAVRGVPVEPPRASTAFEKIMDILNIPRTLSTGFDFGYAFRQGGVLSARNPKEFYSSFAPALRAGVNREYAAAFIDDMKNGRNSAYYKKMGLHIIDPDGPIDLRDEAMASKIAQNIPGIGASARVHAHGLNYIRRGFSDKNIDRLIESGLTGKELDDALVDLGKFTNWATGRGDLVEGKVAEILNAFFFSPRLLASRFQTIKATLPKNMGGLQDDLVRQIARENVAAWITQNAAVLTFLSMTGAATVALDPRDSDFGQIRIGDTRIDPWAGFRPVVVALARALGRVTEAGINTAGLDMELPGEERDDTVASVIGSFAEGKLSPAAGLVWDLSSERLYGGEKIEGPEGVAKAIGKRVIPMTAQDIYEGMTYYGPVGALQVVPSALGLGANTYEDRGPRGGSFSSGGGGSIGSGRFK